jgi:hypothetical protein
MRALGGSYTKESSCVSWFHVKRIFFSKRSLADQHAKEISGSHGGEDDEVVLLDCGAV